MAKFSYGHGIKESGDYKTWHTMKMNYGVKPKPENSSVCDKSDYKSSNGGGGAPYKATKTISTYDGRNMQPDSCVSKIKP